jgi:cobalt-zinc-cadmium efflux system outer membrane protein
VQGLVNWRDEGIGGKPDGSISVGVPLPLWNRNQGAVIQADQQVVAAQRALEQVELALQNRLAPVYERYANAHNQVETFRNRILPAAQESLDLMRRSYQAGEAGYINLLTAQRTYSQMNLNYLEALQELRAAETEIGGLLLSGSLESK